MKLIITHHASKRMRQRKIEVPQLENLRGITKRARKKYRLDRPSKINGKPYYDPEIGFDVVYIIADIKTDPVLITVMRF